MALDLLWFIIHLKLCTNLHAKVELVPLGPGDLVGAVKGVGKLTGDALTFKWAQVCEFTEKLR